MDTYIKQLQSTFVYHSSPIDWCEDNYEISEHIVEFWNTISSFAMVIVAIAGYFFYAPIKHEPHLWLVWLMMSFVGVGSALFHGTLSVAGQILDELPISFLVIYAIIFTRPLKKWNQKLRSLLLSGLFISGTLIFCAIVSLLNPMLSHAIVLSCIPVGVYSFYTEYKQSTSRHVGTMFWGAFFFLMAALAVWISDRFACNHLKSFFIGTIGFYPQFHAFWHIFISCCFWMVVAAGITIRLSGDKKKNTLRYYSGIPYISMV